MSWPSSDRYEPIVHLPDDQMDILGELAEDNEYWEKARGFIMSIQERELSSLTNAQVDWYYNIEASLLREINLKETHEAFGVDSDQYRHERRVDR